MFRLVTVKLRVLTKMLGKLKWLKTRKEKPKQGEKILGDRLLSVALLDQTGLFACWKLKDLADFKDSTPNLIDRWSPCDANVKHWTLHQPQFFFIFYNVFEFHLISETDDFFPLIYLQDKFEIQFIYIIVT